MSGLSMGKRAGGGRPRWTRKPASGGLRRLWGVLAAVAVAAAVGAVPAAGSLAQPRVDFTASWSATNIPEGASATLTVTTTDPSIMDDTQILVTVQVGRSESTADTSDIHVRDHSGGLVQPRDMLPTSHHGGGWLYLKSNGSTFSYEQAKTSVFTISTLDDSDTSAEDLAVWVYVNGYLAGSQTLSLTTDPAFTFGSTTYTATEGGTAATVQVNLPTAPSSSVTIPIEVKSRNNGATSSDHSTVPASLTFTTSDTIKTFTVTATNDTTDDDGESITIGFGTPVPSGYLAVGTTTVVLADNDAPNEATFGANSYTATEGGTAATVAVNLSRAPEASVTIPIEVKSRSGATSSDHSTVPASVTFTTSDTSKTFTVTATDDTADDDGESITIGFGTPIPAGFAATGTTVVNLADNDDTVLVSNTAESTNDAEELRTLDLAQGFTTGSHTAGYTLTSIEVRLSSRDGTDHAVPTVVLVSGTAAHTGTATTLTGPASLDNNTTKSYTFTAPNNTTLTASTTYWILVEKASSGGDDVKWGFTNSNSEDTAETGWTIANSSLYRDDTSTGAFSTDTTSSMMLRVNGGYVGGI